MKGTKKKSGKGSEGNAFTPSVGSAGVFHGKSGWFHELGWCYGGFHRRLFLYSDVVGLSNSLSMVREYLEALDGVPSSSTTSLRYEK